MSDDKKDELPPGTQLEIQSYVKRLLTGWAAIFGIANLAVILAAYFWAVDAAVQKALVSETVTDAIMKAHEQLGAFAIQAEQLSNSYNTTAKKLGDLSDQIAKVSNTDVARWVNVIASHPEATNAIDALNKLPQWKESTGAAVFDPTCTYRAVLKTPSGLPGLGTILAASPGDSTPLDGASLMFTVATPAVLALTVSNSGDTDRLTINRDDRITIIGRSGHQPPENVRIARLEQLCW
jgi:hypothetical protein